jgi:hypothetical protein
MAANEPRPPAPWESVVSVREDLQLGAELTTRYGAESGRRAVGVTDLVSLRRAYYRLVAPPVPIPVERQARLDQGRSVHRALGSRLAREGVLEARVRRDGLVGRIDILADLPIEVKTTTAFVDPSALPTYRPDHLEQLAMYCGLLDRPSGRLLSLLTSSAGVTDVQAVDVSFRSASRILAEMQRRAGLLRKAWEVSKVDELPRCPWYDRGCEFEQASVCDCTGEEPFNAQPLTKEVDELSPRSDVEERLRATFAEPQPPDDAPPVGRFREILYPRRTYFERTVPTPPAPARVAPAAHEPDLYARLSEAVESGPPGEVARLPARSTEPDEEVVGFRGRPVLMRTSRAWARFRADEVVRRAPQYAFELGLRCATTGADSGLVVIGFERAEVDRDRIQVLELRFASLTPFSRMYRERSRALSDAVRERTPETLVPCPSWMAEDCPYRTECGCAESASRDTR